MLSESIDQLLTNGHSRTQFWPENRKKRGDLRNGAFYAVYNGMCSRLLLVNGDAFNIKLALKFAIKS